MNVLTIAFREVFKADRIVFGRVKLNRFLGLKLLRFLSLTRHDLSAGI